MTKSKPERIWLRWIGHRWSDIATLAFALFLGWCWFFPGSSFDADQWLAGVKGSPAREAMARRLISTGELIGKTRMDVLDMLGPPTSPPPYTSHLCYLLGPGVLLDDDYLVLELAPDGRVTSCSIAPDG